MSLADRSAPAQASFGNISLYTRGGPDVADTRGSSMVQKHAEKLQYAKEQAALAAITGVLPGMSKAVYAVALQELDWDPTLAAQLLLQFQQAKAEQLQDVSKRRQQISSSKRPRSGSKEAGAAASAPGNAPSGSSSGSESDSPEDAKHKRRKHKHGKDKHASRHKHRSKDKKRKTRKDSPSKEAAAPAALTQQYGKYGIIRETDIYTKRAEFQMWATDVQKMDIELLPKNEEKELFRSFMEDFNTGTLPHRKYYNVDAYEAEKAAKAAKRQKPLNKEKVAFNDEDERRKEVATERVAAQQQRLREAYNELKYTAPDKAADMREQELLRMQMSLAYRTGDHEKATRLQDRLRPDDQREEIQRRRLEENK